MKPLVVVLTILAASFIGLLFDANVGLDGNFSIVVAISVACGFIVNALDKRK